MDSRFEAKQLKVLLIEPSSSTRAIITETLRDHGIADITGISEPKDALSILEVEPVDWIISAVYANEQVNAFHLLQLVTENGILLPTRMSLLLSDDEKELLPSAYSLGLMSHHPKVITKEVLTQEWAGLFAKFTEHHYNLAFVAADYLRGYLNEICDHPLALNLESNLWKVFPEQFSLLENALPHLQELGEDEKLKENLHKLKLIYGETEEDKWAFLKAAYLPDQDVEGGEGGEADDGLNYKILSRALVVEPDETLHSIYTSIFEDFGADEVHICTDGEAALSYLAENPNPDLVVHEWRLAKVTGPLFLQKALGEGATESQFIVHSSLVAGPDVPLVKELGVATVVEKPMERSRLLKAVVQVIRQDASPRELVALERKVRFAVRKKDLSEAQASLSQYLQSAPSNDKNRFALEAECELLAGNPERAKELGLAAIKAGGHSIFVLSMMGKALSSMGDYSLALKCFEKAQEISPLNFRRLCDIAEIQSTLGQEDEANAAIEGAKAIAGEDDPEVVAAEAKVAVNSGKIEEAKTLLGKLDSLDNVVASLNNQAVAMARCGRYEDSFAQYKKTIESIPDDRPNIKAAVQYNLGLAYTRGERYEDAVAAFETLCSLPTKVGAKAKSLTQRLNKAIAGGTKIVLSSSAPAKTDQEGEAAKAPSGDDPTGHNGVLAHLVITKGSLCCYQIFTLEEHHSKVQGWLANPPRFSVRHSFKGGSDGEGEQQAS